MPPEQQAPTPPQVPPTTSVPPAMTNVYTPAPVTPTPVAVVHKTSWLKWLAIIFVVICILIGLLIGGLVALGLVGQSYLKTMMQFNPVDTEIVEQIIKDGIIDSTDNQPTNTGISTTSRIVEDGLVPPGVQVAMLPVPDCKSLLTKENMEEFAGVKFEKFDYAIKEGTYVATCVFAAEIAPSPAINNITYNQVKAEITFCRSAKYLGECSGGIVSPSGKDGITYTYKEFIAKFMNGDDGSNIHIDYALGGMYNKFNTSDLHRVESRQNYTLALSKHVDVSMEYAIYPFVNVGPDKFIELARKIESQLPGEYR